MRSLLIDIGNTHTKYLVARGSRLGRLSSVPSKALTVATIREIEREAKPDHIVVSSVIESLTRRLRNTLKSATHFLSHESDLGVSLKGYLHPETIGVDRLANISAAIHHWGAPVVTVDAGTALTVDVVDSSGRFRGGTIAPGLLTFANALQDRAPALPQSPLPGAGATRAIGRSTKEALASGVGHGFNGALREILNETLAELSLMERKLTQAKTKAGRPKRPRRPKVILTGGDAALLAKRLDCFDIVCKNLTFEGLLCISQRNPPSTSTE